MCSTFTAIFTSLVLTGATLSAAEMKIGVVDFRKAVEDSKAGKFEQSSFEGMKKQMESILKEKDEEFNKLVTKLRDDDFRDSQKPEALDKMEQQARQLGGELSQAQQQFLQALQQSNMKVLQKLADSVSESSEAVAKSKQLDIILNSDNAFFSKPDLDVTADVIAEMDRLFDEQKSSTNGSPAPLDLKK